MTQAAILDANFFIALWNLLATGRGRAKAPEPPINIFDDILEQLNRGAERQEVRLVTIQSVVDEIGHKTRQGLAIVRLLRKHLDTEEVRPGEVFKEITQLNRRQVPPWFETGWGTSLIPERTDVLLLVLAKELAGRYESVRVVSNDEGLQRALRDLPSLMTFPQVKITEPYMFLKLVEEALEPGKAEIFHELGGAMFRYFRTHRMSAGRPAISEESLPDLLRDVFLRKRVAGRPHISELSKDDQTRIARYLETGAEPSLPEPEQRFLDDIGILKEWRKSKRAIGSEECFEAVDRLVLNVSALLEVEGAQRAASLLRYLWDDVTRGLDHMGQACLLRGELRRVLHLIDMHYMLASFVGDGGISELRSILSVQKALLLLFTRELHRLQNFLTQKRLESMSAPSSVGIDMEWLRDVLKILEGEPLADEIVDPNLRDFLFRLGESLLAFRQFKQAKELLKVVLRAERNREEVFHVILNACRAMNMACEEIVEEFRNAGIEVSEELILDHSDRRLDETLLRRDWSPFEEIPQQFKEKLPVLQHREPGAFVVWIPALNSRFLAHIETEETLWNARTIKIMGGTARIIDLAPSIKKQLNVRGKIELKNPELEVERFIVPI